MRRTLTGAVLAGVAVGYDTLVRPWLLDWGSTATERRERLPGDEIVDSSGVMTFHTRAVTIDAPPQAVWPWLVQVGDRRAGFYSYDWIERLTGTVHYVEGHHSATRIHPELQEVREGDRIDTGSVGSLRIGSPVTVLEPDRALAMGVWAFVLRDSPGGRTRLLVRGRDSGWLRRAAPRRSGLLRVLGGLVDYVVGEPLHFVMERRMMLGLKQRAEQNHPTAPGETSRTTPTTTGR
jgi:hypothetical protein